MLYTVIIEIPGSYTGNGSEFIAVHTEGENARAAALRAKTAAENYWNEKFAVADGGEYEDRRIPEEDSFDVAVIPGWIEGIELSNHYETHVIRDIAPERPTSGVSTTVVRSEIDDVLVVEIDGADDKRGEDQNGPVMRVYLNDGPIYENPPLSLPEDETK